MGNLLNSLKIRADQRTTTRDRTTNHFVVVTCTIASSFYDILPDCIRRSMGNLLDGLMARAHLLAAAFYRTIDHFVIGAFCIAGSCYNILLHRSALRMRG